MRTTLVTAAALLLLVTSDANATYGNPADFDKGPTDLSGNPTGRNGYERWDNLGVFDRTGRDPKQRTRSRNRGGQTWGIGGRWGIGLDKDGQAIGREKPNGCDRC